MQLSQLLLSSGEWDEALVHARAALSLVSAERRVWMDAQVHAALARLFGGRGEWQRAGEHLAAADAAAAAAGTIEAVVTTRVAQAAVARARSDPGQVVMALGPLAENTGLIPMATSLAWWPSLIAAMIDVGELAKAAEQIELLGTAARQRGLNMHARIASVSAQLEAARGRPDQACSSYARAIGLLGADDPVLDRAELHHRFGQLLAVRGGRRRQAVDQLRVAGDLFARAGAEPFLGRVEADLASHGITVGRGGIPVPSAADRPGARRRRPGREGDDQPRGRRRAVCQPEGRRLPPGSHLRQARDHLKTGPAPVGAQLGISPRDGGLAAEHTRSMQIVIDIARSGGGRLAGTARPAGSAGDGRRFAGVMELVACLEQLCATASHHGTPPGPDRGSCPQAPPDPAASQQTSTEGNHHG